MSRSIDISAGQATALVGLLLITQSHVIAPSIMAEYVGRDIWISVILSIMMTGLLAAYIIWLTSRFPEYTLIHISEVLLGRLFGKLVGMIFYLYFVTITVINVQLIIQVFKVMFLPLTPSSLLVVMVLLFAYYASVQGIGTLARMGTILFILSLATVLFLILSVLHDVRFIHYLPLLQSGWSNIGHASLFTFASGGQVVALAMFHPNIRHQTSKHTTITYILGIIIVCFVTGIMIIEFVGLFSAYQLRNLVFPTAELGAMIRIGEFFERSEMLFVTIWTSIMLVTTGFLFTVSYNSLTQLFNRSESFWLRIMTGILVFMSNMLFQGDFDRFIRFMHEIWVYLSIVFQAGLPLLLGLIYLMKKRLL